MPQNLVFSVSSMGARISKPAFCSGFYFPRLSLLLNLRRKVSIDIYKNLDFLGGLGSWT